MPMPPAAHRLRPDDLPTPFSAEQIREGCPAERTIRIREETPGEPPTFRRIRFIEADADLTTVKEVALTLPFGAFDCWLYTVSAPQSALRFWFAKALAGMPVQVEESIDGEPTGRSVMIVNG